MWSLFHRRRDLDLDKEVYGKLRPGDLYGADDRSGRPPELFVRYLLLANASLLTFAAVMLFRVGAGAPAHKELVAVVWLTAMGIAIAAGAWIAFQFSRRGEARALSSSAGRAAGPDPSPPVQAMMKKAAIRKMLALRLLLVSAIAGFIGIYAGIKGLILL